MRWWYADNDDDDGDHKKQHLKWMLRLPHHWLTEDFFPHLSGQNPPHQQLQNETALACTHAE